MDNVASRPTVVIIGGGYGGLRAAKALDEPANVVLVEAKDAFQHNVAALRALVEQRWPPRIFLPYDHLLTNGTVLHDTAVRVDAEHVELASGQRLTYDFLVLATGARYPFPAKAAQPHSVDAIADYRAMHGQLADARRVMILGAGAVGLELAGEIAAVWPDKKITLVDLVDHILPGGYDQQLRDELNRQLDALGAERVLGSPLAELPDVAPGELGTIDVTTTAGNRIEADIWFRCFGGSPVTDYLAADLAAARTEDGHLAVTPGLQVIGFETVYAVGDLAALDVNKAGVAGRQAEVVAANITAHIAGDPERATYTPGPPVIVLPLGPEGGAGQLPNGEIAGAEMVAKVKGRDMMIDRYVELLNLPAPVAT
ncbi:MAG: FAD-dependent oxidoreductase [Pseudonocardia sp.]|jgi:NADH dehydrogenase FAD-containing subunit|nr:FAD-dependent oxidoreductase [Pseudonocardia sp.]